MKSKSMRCLMSIGITSMAFTLAGCDVTPSDVDSAKNEVREEQQETVQARAAGDEAVRVAEANEKQVRETTLRQAREEADEKIADAANETAEARRERAENVMEEQRETAEAKAEADKKAAELTATQARDAYIQAAEAQVEKIDARIADLKNQLAGKQGVALNELETKIKVLEVKRDAVSDAISDLKNEEVLKWESKKARVESAIETANEDN